MKTSCAGLVAAISPGLLMLVLFYSLAVHMKLSLGAWPWCIGEAGFPGALVLHAKVAWQLFYALTYSVIFALGPAFLICAAVPGWRRGLNYIAAYMTSLAVCFVLMELAPEQFLYWWWD